jgi:hypothetical protein
VGRAGKEARDDLGLAAAKAFLAMLQEEIGDGHPGGFLDLEVGVVEFEAEPFGEAPSDRRLSGPHHPDEHDRAVWGEGARGLRGPFAPVIHGAKM